MHIKDISVQAERLDTVRGGRGADVHQSIYNGPTTGLSLAFGSGVNSPVSSTSKVFSGHINTQSAKAESIRERLTSVDVRGSQNVAIGSFFPFWAN